MSEFKDVQGMRPDNLIPIQRAGVKYVRVPVLVSRNSEKFNIVASIDVFVDIPKSRKGADMSRAIESIYDIINNQTNLESLELLCYRIGQNALERFDYSSRVYVYLTTEIFLSRSSNNGKDSLVSYPITIEYNGNRSGKIFTKMKVELLTMNACPCAMETTRSILQSKFTEMNSIDGRIPSVTHNQRNRVSVSLTFNNLPIFELINLIDVIEESLGGSLLSLLKRKDEGDHVLSAHLRPMFVEDIVRHVGNTVANVFNGLSDEVVLNVTSESEESIHPHNAYAEINETLGNLRSSN